MKHETFRELLPLYALGTLDGEELREFERYVAANRDRCGAEIAEFETTASLLALAAPAAQPSPDVLGRVMQAIEGEKRQPVRPSSPPAEERTDWGTLLFRWFPWAATVVLVVALLVVSARLGTVGGRYEKDKQVLLTRLQELEKQNREAIALQKETTHK